nr:hypothetical protein [Pseudomonas chlororaphis]
MEEFLILVDRDDTQIGFDTKIHVQSCRVLRRAFSILISTDRHGYCCNGARRKSTTPVAAVIHLTARKRMSPRIGGHAKRWASTAL